MTDMELIPAVHASQVVEAGQLGKPTKRARIVWHTTTVKSQSTHIHDTFKSYH